MAFNPSGWGGENTSKDYEFMMSGETPVSTPISLVGHAVTSPGQELSDPVTQNYVKKVRGRIVTLQRTLRQAEQIALTFNLLYGSQLWTPAKELARRRNNCSKKFFAVRLCPDRPEFEHAYIYDDPTLSPPVRVNDFITIDDTTIADQQSELRVPEELTLFSLGAYLVHNDADPLYAIAFLTEECEDCQEGTLFAELIAVGGNGTDELVIIKTDNRFGTVSVITNGAPDTSVGRAIWTDGNRVLVGFDDGLGVAAGVAGGTLFSTDRGETFTIDANITAPIRGVGYFNGQYVAVGGTGAGAPLLYVSDDGVNWTAVASALIAGTAAFTSLAVDEEAGYLYIAGETGTLLKGTTVGDTITLADIEPNLPGAPGALNAVHVLAENHIVVVGASGYGAESFDGGETFQTMDVPGSAAINAVAGTQNRAMAGSSTNVSQRDVLNEFTFENITPEGGVTITGDITGLASPRRDYSEEDAMNFFAATTDDGEVLFIKPFYPNS